ncbi:MAG: nitroreductase family protein [Spirochaetia bacterium]|nr:nitroreductase family protein [Spirochaetia bacterium]
MEFFKVIEKRRTIRDFENVRIPEDVVQKIIGAGFKAPTNDHMRDWHFIVIDDRKKVMELLELIPEEFSDESLEQLFVDWNLNDIDQQNCYRNAVPKQYRMLADASVVIIPLFRQKVDLLHPENLSHLNGFASIWCCIENIFLAATAEGYACNLRIPLGNEGEYARKVLGFPEDYLMPCFIGMGKAAANAKIIRQKEISVESRIHKNIW